MDGTTERVTGEQLPAGETAVRGASLTTIAWQQFKKHPMARVALVILGIMYLLAAFADFFAPYPEHDINPNATFEPPTAIHFLDASGHLTWPFIYGMKKTIDMKTFESVWTTDTSHAYPIRLFVHRTGLRDRYVPFPVNLIPIQLRRVIGIRPWATLHLFGVADPGDQVKIHLLGTDDLGADVFGKLMFGARISLTVGILASVVAIAIGMLMGGLAGFYGGWIDEIILRFVEALSAIPDLFLLLTLSAIFYPLHLPSTTQFMVIIVALSVVGWGTTARAVRGQVLSLRERDFTVAAQALGASNTRVITRHLLPQTLSFIIVSLSIQIPGYTLAESVLSFFGLGVQPPSTSWGLMLSTAQSFAGVTGLTDRWWIFTPGIAIFLAVLTWNLLGDGLRDAFDPKSRR
ncbi:MAG: ABC transporter permease [Deinococcales bacterium]